MGGASEVSLWLDRVERQRWVCGWTGWSVRGESVGRQGRESSGMQSVTGQKLNGP